MRKIPWLALLLAVAAHAADGTYTPDKKAAAAYAKATAAGADALPNPAHADATAIAAGETLFQTKCVTCHGPGGKGDGPAAVALDPHPADFTDPTRWKATSVGIKHWIVLNGVNGTGMVPPGLDETQAWQVLAYIEAKLATAGSSSPAPGPAP